MYTSPKRRHTSYDDLMMMWLFLKKHLAVWLLTSIPILLHFTDIQPWQAWIIWCVCDWLVIFIVSVFLFSYIHLQSTFSSSPQLMLIEQSSTSPFLFVRNWFLPEYTSYWSFSIFGIILGSPCVSSLLPEWKNTVLGTRQYLTALRV